MTITGGDRTGAYGGGIRIADGIVLLDSVVVTDNYGRFGTGGIASQGDLTITNSEISNNKTDFEAGAVWVWGDTGKATIRNTTISGNEADNAGGIAVWNTQNSLTLENVTIYDNSAQFGGGGLKFEAGTVEMLNSIVAGNTASDGNDIRGTIVSLGNNIIGDTTQGAGFIASDLKDVDPQLSDLINAGGTTRVHLPLAGSPAIDAGVSTETLTDQIGQLRGSDGNRDGTGAFDIGAVELVLTPVVIVTGTHTVATGTTWGKIAAGDLNQDGYDDFVLMRNDKFRLGSHGAENSSASLLSEVAVNPDHHPLGLGIGDANNDQYLDVLIGKNHLGAGQGVLPFHGDGTYTFSQGSDISNGGYYTPHYVETFDFNKDGTNEIITSNYNNSSDGGVSVIFSSGLIRPLRPWPIFHTNGYNLVIPTINILPKINLSNSYSITFIITS